MIPVLGDFDQFSPQILAIFFKIDAMIVLSA
jgi:hypothetical protein